MKITIVEPHGVVMTPMEEIADFPRKLEHAGRTCYKSEGHITPSSSNRFIRMLLERGHESVIEHCVITARLVGSRSMSHQLVRHRLASYSQESQRFCNYGKKGYTAICPPSVTCIEPGEYDVCVDCEGGEDDAYPSHVMSETHHKHANDWLIDLADAFCNYEKWLARGVKPEDARELLPNACKTEVVTTFNIRMWRHFFRERAFNPHAQWQIKKIARQIFDVVDEACPVLFEDLDTGE